MKNSRGFTLIELLMGLVVTGIVATAIMAVLTSNQRVYQAQTQTMQMLQETRAASFLLASELRELNAADGDIVAMSSNDMTIRVMRQLGFVCVQPVAPFTTGTLVIERNRWWGTRWYDVTRDSLLIFAEGSVGTSDDRWLRAIINTATKTTGACTNGASGSTLTVTVQGLPANGDLASVKSGAPVRGLELERLRLFTDTDGKSYLGMSNLAGSVWSATQQVAGPLTASGLEFQYLDSTGTATANPLLVRSIAVAIRGETAQAVRVAGVSQYRQDSIVTRVALRNNR